MGAREEVDVQRRQIKSGLIRELGYDAPARVLEVQFHPSKKQQAAGSPGPVYRYADVPLAVANALLASEHKGAFFQSKIRDFYKFEKVEEENDAKDEKKIASEEQKVAEQKAPEPQTKV